MTELGKIPPLAVLPQCVWRNADGVRCKRRKHDYPGGGVHIGRRNGQYVFFLDGCVHWSGWPVEADDLPVFPKRRRSGRPEQRSR